MFEKVARAKMRIRREVKGARRIFGRSGGIHLEGAICHTGSDCNAGQLPPTIAVHSTLYHED